MRGTPPHTMRVHFARGRKRANREAGFEPAKSIDGLRRPLCLIELLSGVAGLSRLSYSHSFAQHQFTVFLRSSNVSRFIRLNAGYWVMKIYPSASMTVAYVLFA